jgi:hypothetical protein
VFYSKRAKKWLIKEPTRRCRNCTCAPAHRPTTKFNLNKIVIKCENT